MNIKTIVIVVIICITYIVITLCFLNHDLQMSKQPIVYLSFMPTSLKQLNQTSFTSLVTNTQIITNSTIINLINGMTLQYNGTDIKSGDSISLNAIIFKPICSLSIQSNINKIENNTSVIIHILKDPRCQDGFKGIDIIEWHKLNQK